MTAPARSAYDAFLAVHDPEYPGYPGPSAGRRVFSFWAANSEPYKNAIDSMSSADRTALLVSCVAQHDMLSIPWQDRNAACKADLVLDYRHGVSQAITKRSLGGELLETPALFGAFARLIGLAGYRTWSSALPLLMRMQRIRRRGHVPDAAERRWLSEYLAEERTYQPTLKSDVARRAAHLRRLEEVLDGPRGRTTYTIPEVDPGTPKQPSYYIRDAVPYNAFWLEFLARVADRLAELLREVTEGEEPTWMHDEAAFRAAFPSVGEFHLAFQCWKQGKDDVDRAAGFPGIQKILVKQPGSPLQAEDSPRRYIRGPRIRQIAATEATLRATEMPIWSGAWLPGADILLGPGGEDNHRLLGLLMSGGDASRPTRTWLKLAREVVGRIGRESVADRLGRFLATWNVSLELVETTRGELLDWHAVAGPAYLLSLRIPEMPDVSPDQQKATVSNLAFVCAMSDVAGDSHPVIMLNRSLTSHVTFSPFIYSDLDWPQSTVTLSNEWHFKHNLFNLTTQNERTLRGVAWLLGEFWDDASVRILEEAVANECLSHKLDRSRAVVNIAIASLGEIGTPAALEALGRLNRSIKDKAVFAAILKARRDAGAKRGMSAEDISEISLPDFDVDYV